MYVFLWCAPNYLMDSGFKGVVLASNMSDIRYYSIYECI